MAAQVIDVLLQLKTLAQDAHAAGRGEWVALGFQRIALRSAAQIGRDATAGRGNKTTAKHHALFNRILGRFEDYLRFTTDPAVPFDNNASEREIRMCKLRIKVSGSRCAAPRNSAASAPTYRPRRSTASDGSMP